MWKHYFTHRLYGILSILSRALSVIMEVGLALILKYLIDKAATGDINEILRAVLFSLVYVFVSAFVNFIAANTRRVLLKRIRQDLIIRAMTSLHLGEHNLLYRNTSSYYLNLLTKGMDTIESTYFEVIFEAAFGLLQAIIAISLLFSIDVYLGFFVVLLTLIQISIPKFTGKNLDTINNEHIHANNSLLASINDILDGHRIIRYYNAYEHFRKVFSGHVKNEVDTRKRLSMAKFALGQLSFVVGEMMFVGIYALGGILIVINRLVISDIVAAAQLMTYVAFPVMRLSSYLVEIKSSQGLRNEFLEILNPRQKDWPRAIKTFPADWETIKSENISFSYDQKTGILQPITFEVKRNEKCTILGISGSGKSTLFKLLMRELQPDTGKITIDDIEISQFEKHAYHDRVLMLDQHDYIFDGSVKENVTLFNDTYSDEDVISALRTTGLEDLLVRLDYDLDTRLTKNIRELSGGEKKRISLARMLLRKPSILLLDEITANLDPASRTAIEKMLLSLEDVTIFYITHFENSEFLRASDQIINIA